MNKLSNNYKGVIVKDVIFMKEALKEAEIAKNKNEVPIGCVIVKDDEIIARGHNLVESTGNPLKHAELIAIEEASKSVISWRLHGCTMYVTLEPCAMCSGALVYSRIDRVVFGVRDYKRGFCGSIDNLATRKELNHKFEVTSGIMERDCLELIQEFFKDIRKRKIKWYFYILCYNITYWIFSDVQAYPTKKIWIGSVNINRYYSLSDYFKNKYGNKILKLSINGGFSCPNRENGLNGCLFCSEDGSGKFAGSSNLSIAKQIKEQIEFLKFKSKSEMYIAYFQSFTNTYDKVENLRKKYFEALSHENIIGLAIATRPDCIDDDMINLFKEINKNKELWIELGFQTSNEETASIVRRGYVNKVFEDTLKKLNNAGIKTVTHLIFGLPYETEEDWLKSNLFNPLSRLGRYQSSNHQRLW